MGRGVQLEPQVSVEHLHELFAIGSNSGELIRRERPIDSGGYNAKFAGEPATYRDHDGVLRARFSYRGARRTATALRIAWIVAAGSTPRGRVYPRNGDDGDLRFANLALAKSGPRDHGLGGRAQALERRAEADRAVLEAMAAQPGASLSALSAATGQARSAVCARLRRLAERDLACGPMCVPGRAWILTDQGREIAMAGRPLIDAV